ILQSGTSNDIAKYCLPESYKTELTWTINARSLQNFLHLRSSKDALWEIRNLANVIYGALPEEHKYLFEDCMKL
ncbi:MAG: FAD-dependent thymidylate synthase, partial [Epsilonproteobacteria bacterium]|nr:FAD-dependent thymidylate synthase [Campylobacterota bacterium]